MAKRIRCSNVAKIHFSRMEHPVDIRCDLDLDHLHTHAMIHDDVVLLIWGIDDDGIGVIMGGDFATLFPGRSVED